MQNVKERDRHPSPGGRPQPLAFHGNTLWTGSWDTNRLHAIDPQTWRVVDEIAVPGRPYGLAAMGGELRVVVSIGDDDDRYFYRFTPGQGFDSSSKTACPELTGSHLASDGTTLYLAQMTFKKILALDAEGAIVREVALPTRCAGMGFRNHTFHIIACDDEFENLELATLDVESAAPQALPLAGIPFDARSLAFQDGAWWTSHREASEIVSFTM